MNKTNNLIFAIIIVLIIAGALFYFGVLPARSPSTTATSTTSGSAACTMEAKQCPDGSYVGRIGPNCEFAACPTTASSSTASSTHVIASSSAPTSANTQAYDIGLGQTTVIDGVSVTPLSVLEDSRCPINVQCIQAGTVRVSVKLQKGVLSTTQNLTLGQPVSAEGYTGELIQVTPVKVSGTTIAPSDYRFVFTVSRS